MWPPAPAHLQLQAQAEQLARAELAACCCVRLEPLAHAGHVSGCPVRWAGHDLVEGGPQRGGALRGAIWRRSSCPQRLHALAAAALGQLGARLQRLQQLGVRHKGAQRLKFGDGQRHLRLVVGVLVDLRAMGGAERVEQGWLVG